METKAATFAIKKYTEDFRPELLQVWERSVLATHHFLSSSDYEEIKALVQTVPFHQLDVYLLLNGNRLAGFIGVQEQKVDMLFLDPDFTGRGGGKMLMEFAVNTLSADKVDVNEQNTGAAGFYQRLGFEIYERTDADDQGKPYPLLRMKLLADKKS